MILIEAHPGGQVGVAMDSGVAGSIIPVLLVNRSSVTGSINDLDDVDTVTTPPNNGDHLAWDGLNWVPVAPLTFGEYKGTFDASIGTFPVTDFSGNWFNTTVAGTVDGQNFGVGDVLIALVDSPSTVTFAGNWSVIPNISVTDHTLLTNIGVNTHVQIDTHIADGTLHFTEASIDHDNILNSGVNTHATIDSHIGDGTIHFTVASIDHTAIGNIGTNDHAAIDTHIADTSIHGSFSGLGIWNYRTAVDAFPTAGRLQFDNLSIDIATEMYVHQENAGGTDVSVFMDLIQENDLVYVQIQGDGSQFIIVQTGLPTKAGSVYTFPIVAAEGQGTAPSNNTGVAFVTSTGGGAPALPADPPARSIVIENPTAADNFALFFADVEITVSQLNFVLQGATNATAFVRYGADRSAAGTNVINAGTVVSNTTTGQEITVFDNAVIPAGSWVWVAITAVTGTPTEINVSLRFV